MLNPLIDYVDNNSARKKKNNAMEASLCFEESILTYSKTKTPERERHFRMHSGKKESQHHRLSSPAAKTERLQSGKLLKPLLSRIDIWKYQT